MSGTDHRTALAELQALHARTEADERRILEQAEHMLADLSPKLEKAEQAAKLGDEGAEAVYQQLVLDRGKLNIVIAKARQTLGE